MSTAGHHAQIGFRLLDLTAELGLDRPELARALGAEANAWNAWLADPARPEPFRRDRLTTLESLAAHLRESFVSPDAASAWLRSASGCLAAERPLDAVCRGEADRAEAALEAHHSGIFV